MRVIVSRIILALYYAKFGLANNGEPSDLEKVARIDPETILQIDDTPEEIQAEKPYAPEASNVEGLLKLNVLEVVLVFVDVQNDFTDYHTGHYKPTLAVPGSKKAIAVMNAIRLAGDFSEESGTLENRFCAIYRSEDYHVADSFTFASSPCWLNPFKNRFFARKETDLSTYVQITEYKTYKFDLVASTDDAKNASWKFPWTITLWPEHCIVGTYGQLSHEALLKDKAKDRIVLKAVYKYRESLTAVVESYIPNQKIVEAANKYNNETASERDLINMKLDLKNFKQAKYIVVMGFEYMNCVGETAKSLTNLTDADGQKYTVIIPTDAVGYFAPPKHKKRENISEELRKLGVLYVNSNFLAFRLGQQSNHVKNYINVEGNPARA